MKRSHRAAAALTAALSAVFPILASANLVGEYEGKIQEVGGYRGQVGEGCVVKIGTSDRFGGSTAFSINDSDTFLFENKEVDAALASKDPQVKLHTAGVKGKCAETVIVKRRADGALAFVKLKLVCGIRHTEKSITCGDLTKK
jgi:hypothetical protein